MEKLCYRKKSPHRSPSGKLLFAIDKFTVSICLKFDEFSAQSKQAKSSHTQPRVVGYVSVSRAYILLRALDWLREALSSYTTGLRDSRLRNDQS